MRPYHKIQFMQFTEHTAPVKNKMYWVIRICYSSVTTVLKTCSGYTTEMCHERACETNILYGNFTSQNKSRNIYKQFNIYKMKYKTISTRKKEAFHKKSWSLVMILTFPTTEMRIILDSLWSLSQPIEQVTEDIEPKRNDRQRLSAGWNCEYTFRRENPLSWPSFIFLLLSDFRSILLFPFALTVYNEKSLNTPLSNDLFLSVMKSVIVACASRSRVERKIVVWLISVSENS
jgi:hypothetical protein